MAETLEWYQVFPTEHPRDLVGYAGNTPNRESCWPNKARVAVQFVINYEEVSPNYSITRKFSTIN